MPKKRKHTFQLIAVYFTKNDFKKEDQGIVFLFCECAMCMLNRT